MNDCISNAKDGSDNREAKSVWAQRAKRLGIGIFVIFLGAVWFAIPPKQTPPKPILLQTEKAIKSERRLQNGDVVAVVFHGPLLTASRVEKLGGLEISLARQPVNIPVGAFSDLRNVDLHFEVAEAAKDTFVFFTGGDGTNAWRVRFVVRGNRLLEREFNRGSAPPDVVRYLPEPTFSAPIPFATQQAISVQLSQPRKLPQKVSP